MIDQGLAEGIKMQRLPESTTIQANLNPFGDFEVIILILSGLALIAAIVLIVNVLRGKDKDKDK